MAQVDHKTDSKAFIVYKDWEGLFALLSDRMAGVVIKALFAYACTGEMPKLSGAAQMAFLVMTKQLARDGEKWEQICAHRSEAGKKGGRPRKPSAAEEIPAEAPVPAPAEHICADECGEALPGSESVPEESPAPTDSKTFSPPTVQQVAEYCSERGNRIDAQAFTDYYTANGWTVGRSPMRDWRAAVRRWEQNGIEPQRSSGSAPTSIDMNEVAALVNNWY
jgi:hypothetical protein